MTENDKKLIQAANTYSCIDWGVVDQMAKKAESEEAQKILREKATRMYHQEEYFAGLL